MAERQYFYGVEFVRNSVNGGVSGDTKGYHQMLGDPELIESLPYHNLIKLGTVKDGRIDKIFNQLNIRQNIDDTESVLDGTDGSDIMQIWPDLYMIIGGTNETYERYLVSDRPFTYENDEAHLIKAHAVCPDYECVSSSKARSVISSTISGSQGISSRILNISDEGYRTNKGYPGTSITRYNYEAYARNKNTDNTKNIPYANSYCADVEVEMAMMYIEFRSKDLNGIISHGVSSNVSSAATINKMQTFVSAGVGANPEDQYNLGFSLAFKETDWGKATGVRVTKDGGLTYKYYNFSSSIYINGTSINLWSAFNSYRPLLRIMEAQLAVSDGAYLKSVKTKDGFEIQGKEKGVMTGIYKKFFSFDWADFGTTAAETPTTYQAEVCLVVPIWRGMTRLWGHLWQHCSGYEIVLWKDENNVVHNTLYRAKKVEDLTNDNSSRTPETQTSLEGFPFVGVYEEVCDLGNASGYKRESIQNEDGITILMGKTNGASLTTYECAYLYLLNSVAEGSFVRRCSLLRSFANSDYASLRWCYAIFAPSLSSSDGGGGFRVELMD